MDAKKREFAFSGRVDELVLTLFASRRQILLPKNISESLACPTWCAFNAKAYSFAIHLQRLMEQPPDTPPSIPSVQSKSTRGALVRIMIFFALAGVFFLAIDAIFTPWAFF